MDLEKLEGVGASFCHVRKQGGDVKDQPLLNDQSLLNAKSAVASSGLQPQLSDEILLF